MVILELQEYTIVLFGLRLDPGDLGLSGEIAVYVIGDIMAFLYFARFVPFERSRDLFLNLLFSSSEGYLSTGINALLGAISSISKNCSSFLVVMISRFLPLTRFHST